MGAIFGGGIGLLFNDSTSIFLLPLMILFGAIGGAFWASIPALLKTKFCILRFGVGIFVFGTIFVGLDEMLSFLSKILIMNN